ncbi:membrane protein insertase YidC [Dactylosporangium sp. NPDC048998]|uniref:membrane protein insertase YidC n=1 Tax=Dactylosporangium sp. NPDC048998 TaxID=3363976 RepID=UPI00371D8688
MGGIYWLISKVMLFWHTVWDSIMSDHRVVGTNWQWVLAIVFLVITVRVVLFPIFVKQIKSQRAMQAIQPKMKELQEKHKGDRETLQKEVMKLYQEEKVNPLMGCLPMFLQIPVFIGLLHVLRHLKPGTSDHQMQLYGWSKEEFLSAVDARLFDAPIVAKFSSSTADLIKIDASSTAVKIVAACLVALMITTTYLTQRQMIKKTGWNTDPQQRMIQKFMLYGIPFFTLTSGWYFPIGVIIYWVTNNAITLAQQYWVLHKYPPPASASVNTVPFKSGGTAKVSEPKPSGFAALFSRAKEEAAAQRANGKGTVKATGGKATGAKATGAQATDSAANGAPSRAPRPGAKPINPKKGGAAKRQSG